MDKNTILFIIIAALGGFIGGFWLANSINRSAINSVGPQKSEVAASNSNSSQSKEEPDLTDDEIKTKISEADKNPTNFSFQKDLGVALYRYSALKQDQDVLGQSVRILERAKSLNTKDFDVLVALGNAHFDMGFAKKDAAEYQKAREIYTNALDVKPGDPDVSTDLGLTYYLQDPPAYDKAAAQLQKVSDANPKHTRSLQFLVQILVKQNKIPEADKALTKLENIDPKYDGIPELTAQISAAKSGTK